MIKTIVVLLFILVVILIMNIVPKPVLKQTAQKETIPLALNPSVTALEVGDQAIISVNSDNWISQELVWGIRGTSENTLSSSIGPAVMFTAKEVGETTVFVEGKYGNVEGQAFVTFTIINKIVE